MAEKSAGGTRTSGYTGENTHTHPLRSLRMAPSPLMVLTDSSSEGLAPDALPRLAAEGDGGAR